MKNMTPEEKIERIHQLLKEGRRHLDMPSELFKKDEPEPPPEKEKGEMGFGTVLLIGGIASGTLLTFGTPPAMNVVILLLFIIAFYLAKIANKKNSN